MLLLAIAMLAPDYPAFNADHARELCRTRVADPSWKQVHGSIEGCIDSERADYHHFALLTAQAEATLAPAFGKCITEWTKDGLIDWGMADLCATDIVNGKRDYDLFRTAARTPDARRAIRGCVTQWTDEGDKVVDWDMVGSCARKAFPD